jgi:hypothetical protein
MDNNYEICVGDIPQIENINYNELIQMSLQRLNVDEKKEEEKKEEEKKEEEEKVLNEEEIDDQLLRKLLKPFVDPSTFKEIKKRFIFIESNTSSSLPNINNNNITNQMLKIKTLLTFERSNSAKLSLISKEEIAYFVFSGYQSIIKYNMLNVSIRNLSPQNFQHFQSISIFLLQNNLSRNEEENIILNRVLRKCTEALEDPELSSERRFGIIDIFLHACQDDVQRMRLQAELEAYRNRNNYLNGGIRNGMIRKDKYEIATDSQNVHDAVINTLYRRKCIIIEKDSIPNESFRTTMNKYKELRKKHVTLLDKIKLNFSIETSKTTNFAFDRIATDPTKFSPTQLTLSDIFQRIFYRILKLQHKDYFADILQRIEEECIEMQETCATGHMTRLFNILSGYPEVDIEVVSFYVDDMEKQLRETFEQLNNNSVQGEQLMDSYISFDEEERKVFNEYVRRKETIKQYYLLLKRIYIFQNKTHNEFLFKEDFAEAYSKFGNFTLKSSEIKI